MKLSMSLNCHQKYGLGNLGSVGPKLMPRVHISKVNAEQSVQAFIGRNSLRPWPGLLVHEELKQCIEQYDTGSPSTYMYRIFSNRSRSQLVTRPGLELTPGLAPLYSSVHLIASANAHPTATPVTKTS